MQLVTAGVQVVVGSIVLFAIARFAFAKLLPSSGWLWVAVVGLLALSNMVVHRLIGSGVNPPFYTAVLFAIPVSGLTYTEAWSKPWPKRATYAVVIGTVLGWISYAELVYSP